MKTLVKRISIFAFMFLAVFAVSAQTEGEEPVSEEPTTTVEEPAQIRERLRENLSEEQKDMLQERKQLATENRDAFKATLTDEQRAILENQEMTREEKQEALQATLTEEQKELLANNRAAMKAQREAFRETLDGDQKAAMKKRMLRKGKSSQGGSE